MSQDDDLWRDDLAEFNMAGIEQAVATYQPIERPSQRRAARRLEPLIKHILAGCPELPTAKVRQILENNHRSGLLPNTSTFNRELGSICREVKLRQAAAGRTDRPAQRSKRNVTGGTQSKPRPVFASAPADPTPMRVGTAEREAETSKDAVATPASPAVQISRPLDLFDGKFAGKVFIHTTPIRAFFSAVDKRAGESLLRQLAHQAADDPESQACLDKLHPRDRAILDAALALA